MQLVLFGVKLSYGVLKCLPFKWHAVREIKAVFSLVPCGWRGPDNALTAHYALPLTVRRAVFLELDIHRGEQDVVYHFAQDIGRLIVQLDFPDIVGCG